MSAEYVELSRPLLIVPDQPCSYQLTGNGRPRHDEARHVAAILLPQLLPRIGEQVRFLAKS